MHKPHTDENEVVCWCHDHAIGRSVKGINLLTTFYYSQNGEQPLKLPVAFDIVRKYSYCNIKDRKELRKSPVTKNELMRNQLLQTIKNQIKFSYVLADSWFSSGQNMKFIHQRKILSKIRRLPNYRQRQLKLSARIYLLRLSLIPNWKDISSALN